MRIWRSGSFGTEFQGEKTTYRNWMKESALGRFIGSEYGLLRLDLEKFWADSLT